MMRISSGTMAVWAIMGTDCCQADSDQNENFCDTHCFLECCKK